MLLLLLLLSLAGSLAVGGGSRVGGCDSGHRGVELLARRAGPEAADGRGHLRSSSHGGGRGPEASGGPSGLVTAITPRPITPFQSPRQAAAAIRIFVTFISEVLSVLLTYLVSSGD